MKKRVLEWRSFDAPDDVFGLYASLAQGVPGEILLESARQDPRTGRSSLILKDPFLEFRAKGQRSTVRDAAGVRRYHSEPLKHLARLLERYRVDAPEAPFSFCGGAAGYFGYEAKNLIEPRLRQTAVDDLGLPDILLYFYDRGIVFDHRRGSAAVFALGTSKRQASGVCDALLREVERPALVRALTGRSPVGEKGDGVRSNMTRRQFCERVRRAKRYIRSGDIYQANLSQRFQFELKDRPIDVYERLRAVNPSPFFGLFEAGEFSILSGSPERLLSLRSGELETRPIAGTRPSAKENELLLSEKERAEHVMLVDLERNDLGRVAEYGTVVVDELFALERYSHVSHIVSNVRARLRPDLTPLDAFLSFFPGGTITGTPKIRSMQVIDELEPTARGPYTGSLGYFSFNGDMDWNILIRSLTVKDSTATLQVGAGIVADSRPEKEYAETLHKAQAVLEAAFGPRARCRAADNGARKSFGL